MDLYEIRQALNSGKTIYELPLRVAYYARVSTDKEEQLHSLTAQIDYYQTFIRDCPSWQLAEGYVDEGISGTSVRNRTQFLRMMEDARAHRFDFVVTKEISRFSRNTLDSIRFTQELLGCGVGVLFQSDNINTLLPDAELRLTIMSSVAQEEVRKISERVKFGFRRAIEKGVVLGSNRIWGYRKQEGRLVIEEQEAKIVRQIFDLYANQQLGIRAVSAWLTEHGVRNSQGHPFSFSTIRGILANPKYKGWYCGGKSTKIDYKLNTVKTFSPEEWVLYEDTEAVPPIVSEALWNKANQLLAERGRRQSAADRTVSQNRYPYSGKIFCGIHRAPYYRSIYRTKNGAREVWQCREYVRNGRVACDAPSLYTYEADSIIRKIMEEIRPQLTQLAEELLRLYTSLGEEGKLEDTLSDCEAKLEGLLRRKDCLLDLRLDGSVSAAEFHSRMDRFREEECALRAQLTSLRKQRQEEQAQLVKRETLRKRIGEELRFEQGFTGGVLGALLDRLEVFRTDDRLVVEVRAHLRGASGYRTYEIRRRRGQPSVCSERSI